MNPQKGITVYTAKHTEHIDVCVVGRLKTLQRPRVA